MLNRFEWFKAVLQSDLPDRAKVLAGALAVKFGNDETGQINPGLDLLAEYLRSSEDTVRRGVADLERAGWLGKTVGRGRGNRTVYVLLAPGKVVVLHRKSASAAAEMTKQGGKKRSQECQLKDGKKGRTAAAKRSQNCNRLYKEEQSSEQRQAARPSPHLATEIRAGSWQALEWNKWLSDHAYPQLAEMKALHTRGGYLPPWATPPRAHDPIGNKVAKSVIEWALHQSPGKAA